MFELIFGEFEFIADSRLVAIIADADHGHVAQEVDGADFNLDDLHAQALLEIGNELRTSLRRNEFDTVVLDQACRARLDMEFAKPYCHQEDRVGKEHLEEGHIDRDRIDQREGDDDKEICHLADWHGIRTITHDGEDAEESDTHTHRGLALHILEHENHEEDDEEDGHRDEHERKVEVATTALTVVQTVDNQPCERDVDQQTDKHHHKIIGQFKKFHILILFNFSFSHSLNFSFSQSLILPLSSQHYASGV